MALTKCKECKKEVSTKAEACPHCGARLKEKSGCLSYIFVGTFLFLVLGVLFNNGTDTSSVLESSSLKNIKKDPETQAKRKDLIDDLISQDIFKRIDTPGTLPRIYVGDTFYNLSFEDKTQFASVVLAYYYSQSKEIKIVLIYDNRNNKKVGSYNAVTGLDLN